MRYLFNLERAQVQFHVGPNILPIYHAHESEINNITKMGGLCDRVHGRQINTRDSLFILLMNSRVSEGKLLK